MFPRMGYLTANYNPFTEFVACRCSWTRGSHGDTRTRQLFADV